MRTERQEHTEGFPYLAGKAEKKKLVLETKQELLLSTSSQDWAYDRMQIRWICW